MTHANGDSSGAGPVTSKAFATIDLDADADAAHLTLASLHAQVVGGCGRIELRHRGGACVLISRDELESLEQALEILSCTDTVRLMRQEIALVAQAATPITRVPPRQPATTSANGRFRSFNLP